jgi:hypothetical protein
MRAPRFPFYGVCKLCQLKLGHFHQPVGKCAADTCSLVPPDSAIESQGAPGVREVMRSLRLVPGR